MTAHPRLRVRVDGVPAADVDVRTEWEQAGLGWLARVTVAYTGPDAVDGSVLVEAVVPGADDPWWLIPGAFYGETRPAANDRVLT